MHSFLLLEHFCTSEKRKWLIVDFAHAVSKYSHLKNKNKAKSMAETVRKFIKDAHDATLNNTLED